VVLNRARFYEKVLLCDKVTIVITVSTAFLHICLNKCLTSASLNSSQAVLSLTKFGECFIQVVHSVFYWH